LPKSLVPCQLLDKENVFVCTAAKENLTSVREILLWFWQTKGSLDQALKYRENRLAKSSMTFEFRSVPGLPDFRDRLPCRLVGHMYCDVRWLWVQFGLEISMNADTKLMSLYQHNFEKSLESWQWISTVKTSHLITHFQFTFYLIYEPQWRISWGWCMREPYCPLSSAVSNATIPTLPLFEMAEFSCLPFCYALHYLLFINLFRHFITYMWLDSCCSTVQYSKFVH
jgi:hypothetical protein